VKRLIAPLIFVGILVVSCLTMQEKERITKAERDVAEAKATLAKLVPESVEAKAAAEAVLKANDELLLAKAEGKAAANQRGVQIAEAFIESSKAVIPFVPYGEFAVPVIGLLTLILKKFTGGEK